MNVRIATCMFCHKQWVKLLSRTKKSGGKGLKLTGNFCDEHPEALVGFEDPPEGVAAIANER